MIRRDRHLRLSRWLTGLILCFIWGNSLLPGSLSGAFSDWVRDLLAGVLPGEIPGVTSGGGLLRKIAHFTEFAALGLCLGWQFGMLEKRKITALICGSGAACVDETIQLFVPDRGPGLKDVAIDTCGVAAGILVYILTQKIRYKIQQQRRTRTQ